MPSRRLGYPIPASAGQTQFWGIRYYEEQSEQRGVSADSSYYDPHERRPTNAKAQCLTCKENSINRAWKVIRTGAGNVCSQRSNSRQIPSQSCSSSNNAKSGCSHGSRQSNAAGVMVIHFGIVVSPVQVQKLEAIH